MFTMTIQTDNAAFDGGPGEVARLLREAADKIETIPLVGGAWWEHGVCFDANGNKVGHWYLEQEAPEVADNE